MQFTSLTPKSSILDDTLTICRYYFSLRCNVLVSLILYACTAFPSLLLPTLPSFSIYTTLLHSLGDVCRTKDMSIPFLCRERALQIDQLLSQSYCGPFISFMSYAKGIQDPLITFHILRVDFLVWICTVSRSMSQDPAFKNIERTMKRICIFFELREMFLTFQQSIAALAVSEPLFSEELFKKKNKKNLCLDSTE